MKTFLAVLMMLALFASAVYAAGDLMWTPQQNFHAVNQAGVQAFAPQGDLAVALSVASTTVDMTNYILYGVTTGSSGTCYYRQMATSTKSGTAVPLANSTFHLRAKNPATAFVNFSGCTGAYLQEQ